MSPVWLIFTLALASSVCWIFTLGECEQCLLFLALVCGNSLADWVMRCWICVCCDCIPYLKSKTLRDSAVPLLLGMGRYQEQISITRVPYVYGRFLQVELSTCQRQVLHKGLIPREIHPWTLPSNVGLFHLEIGHNTRSMWDGHCSKLVHPCDNVSLSHWKHLISVKHLLLHQARVWLPFYPLAQQIEAN